jgi:hypothetical protein
MPVRPGWALVLSLCVAIAAGPIEGQPLREYQAKGAFLVNFAKFIEWSDELFESAAAPVEVCVAGEAWVYEELETVMRQKFVGKRPVRLRPRGETSHCHLLFVVGDQRPEPIFQSLPDFTVRVGEQPRFLSAGGHISFHLHGDRIHFGMNDNVAHQKRFRVSSRLLALAHTKDN